MPCACMGMDAFLCCHVLRYPVTYRYHQIQAEDALAAMAALAERIW